MFGCSSCNRKLSLQSELSPQNASVPTALSPEIIPDRFWASVRPFRQFRDNKQNGLNKQKQQMQSLDKWKHNSQHSLQKIHKNLKIIHELHPQYLRIKMHQINSICLILQSSISIQSDHRMRVFYWSICGEV